EGFFAGDDSGRIALYDLAGGELRSAGAVNFGIRALAAMPDGRVAVAGEHGRIVLWDPRENQITQQLAGYDAPVSVLAAGGKGTDFRLVAAGGEHGKPSPSHPLTAPSPTHQPTPPPPRPPPQ